MGRPKEKRPTIKRKTLRLFNRVNAILKPPPKQTVSEWADAERRLSAEDSAEPGRFRTDRAPYQRRMQDAISDPNYDTVVYMTSAQIGKTVILLNVVGYHIDYDPAPIMVMQPTLDMAQTFSKKRLQPMIRDTPALRGKVKDSKSRDSDNTILEKGFPGGYVVMVGANAASSLASRPIRILLADEVDRFPASAGDEGDPLKLAEKRTKTFWNKKKVYVSTPTVKGVSRIEKEYESSTREQWHVPCPECGKHQPYTWEQIKFQYFEEDNVYHVHDVGMTCKFCGAISEEVQWKQGDGQWIARNPDAKKLGFHINAFASPWEAWESIVEDFLEARKDKETLKVWINTMLGESWEEEEGDQLEHEHLYKNRREIYNADVPEGVLLLTAGVDVQDDRLEVEVVGWGLEMESWGIEYRKFFGDPDKVEVWEALDEYLKKSFECEDGSMMKLTSVCVDSGGHFTQEVYRFTKAREHRRIFSVKGMGGPGRALIHKHSKNNREKATLFILGVDDGKTKIMSRLKTETIGPGYCHFPREREDELGRGYTEEYFKGLTSERFVTERRAGKIIQKWIKKPGIRNEPLDLRNYATAAVEIAIPDPDYLYRLDGRKNTQKPVQRTKMKKKRRMHSSGV